MMMDTIMDNNKMTTTNNSATIMKFENPIPHRLVSYLLGCLWLFISLAAIIHLMEPLFNENRRLLSLRISVIDFQDQIFVERYTHYLLRDGMIILPILALVAASFAFSLFPTIEVRDEGIKVSTLFGLLSSKWLAWSAVIRVRKLPLLPSFYVLGIRNVGVIYYPIGLLLWVGRGGVPLMSGLSNQKRLIKFLHDKRPDLF
ncbi:MAG: hypothetical protein IPM39_16640 [Chloroflexi bacterium]|nr:hypothetical protein [Chloroflexota bacterium]